jgi:hypothetical protein
MIKNNPAKFLAYTEEASGLIAALDSQLEVEMKYPTLSAARTRRVSS